MFSCKESFELATQLNRFAIVDEDELLAWAETVEHREYCRMALCGGKPTDVDRYAFCATGSHCRLRPRILTPIEHDLNGENVAPEQRSRDRAG